VRILVVEDEEVAAARLVRLTRTVLGNRLLSLDQVSSLAEAEDHITSHAIDLLFLDLNLSGRDGFELLNRAAAAPFQTIIVSAQHDQALRAFEYGVTDFVAKPYDEKRLRQALQRFAHRETTLRERLRYLAVRKGQRIVPIPLTEVLYIQGADDYSEIHCADGSRHLHSKSLSALEQILPARFQRVHRSYIVNSVKINTLRSEPGSRYFACLVTGAEIPISRARFKDLKNSML